LGICDEDESFALAKTYWFSPICLSDVGDICGLLYVIQLVPDLREPRSAVVDFIHGFTQFCI
jgi:hypothetical protein